MKIPVPAECLCYKKLKQGYFGVFLIHIVVEKRRESRMALKKAIGFGRFLYRCEGCSHFHNLGKKSNLCMCVNSIQPFKTTIEFGCRMCDSFQLP